MWLKKSTLRGGIHRAVALLTMGKRAATMVDAVPKVSDKVIKARQQLRGSREYRRCEAQRASSEWSRSAGTPHTRACHLAAWDAGLARNYTWHVDWSATTPPVRRWVDRAQTLAKARASNEGPHGDSSRKRPLLGRSW